MKRILLVLPVLAMFLMPVRSAAEENTYSRTSHYSADLSDLKWYQKIAVVILGLDWEEFSIRTTFSRDKDGNEKVISVCAWPDNTEIEVPEESDLVFQLSRSTEIASFLHFIKKTKFKESEIAPLLDLYTYLYDLREQEMKFDSENLFEKESGNMRSRFSKKIHQEGNSVSIRTLNGSGAENGWVEVEMKSLPEKNLIKIEAKLKIGVKFTLTTKEKEE